MYIDSQAGRVRARERRRGRGSGRLLHQPKMLAFSRSTIYNTAERSTFKVNDSCEKFKEEHNLNSLLTLIMEY